MEDKYSKFREAIYTTPVELKRFRELVVNSVLATDIMDKELKNLRNGRWDKAFKEDHSKEEIQEQSRDDVINRKATIVIEHLIQASDVAHTMQHWDVYRTWNKRFFRECYQAFLDGRAEKDPSVGWYRGEIGFFDFVSNDFCFFSCFHNRISPPFPIVLILTDSLSLSLSLSLSHSMYLFFLFAIRTVYHSSC